MSVATLTIRVSVDTNKVEYVSGPGNSNFVNGRVIYTWTDPNGGASPITSGTIATFKFKAKQTGTASFSVSGEFYDSNENVISPSFSGTSVSLQEKEATSPSGNTGNNNQTGGTASNNNQTTTGGSTSNNTGGSQTSSGGTSLGGTTSKPQTGTGNTAQTTNHQNNNTNNNESSNANVNLKELHLSVEGISPSFNANTVQYYLVVSNLINDIDVVATPEDQSAKVEITGNKNLAMGSNVIQVKVTSSDGKASKIYTINVSKTDDKEHGNADLENLAIENVSIVPEFSSDIYEYTAEVGSDIENLNVLAIPQKENARSSNRRK